MHASLTEHLRCHAKPPTQVYGSSVTPQVKRQCLITIAKMLHFNSGATLAALLEDLPISSLVAALLGARDATVVAYGMQVRTGAPGQPCAASIQKHGRLHAASRPAGQPAHLLAGS